jgi:hypothetical protein
VFPGQGITWLGHSTARGAVPRLGRLGRGGGGRAVDHEPPRITLPRRLSGALQRRAHSEEQGGVDTAKHGQPAEESALAPYAIQGADGPCQRPASGRVSQPESDALLDTASETPPRPPFRHLERLPWEAKPLEASTVHSLDVNRNAPGGARREEPEAKGGGAGCGGEATRDEREAYWRQIQLASGQ